MDPGERAFRSIYVGEKMGELRMTCDVFIQRVARTHRNSKGKWSETPPVFGVPGLSNSGSNMIQVTWFSFQGKYFQMYHCLNT